MIYGRTIYRKTLSYRGIPGDPVLAASQHEANRAADVAENEYFDHVWGGDDIECCETCLNAYKPRGGLSIWLMCRRGRYLLERADQYRDYAERWEEMVDWYVKGGRARFNSGDWIAR